MVVNCWRHRRYEDGIRCGNWYTLEYGVERVLGELEFFGIYDIFGKFSAIMGPIIFALFSQITGNSRFGVLSVMIQFTIGGTIFILAGRGNRVATSINTAL